MLNTTFKHDKPDLESLRQEVDALRAVQKTLEESLRSTTGALDRAMSAYTIQMLRYHDDSAEDTQHDY